MRSFLVILSLREESGGKCSPRYDARATVRSRCAGHKASKSPTIMRPPMACRSASPDAGAGAHRFFQLLVAPVDVLPEVELPVSHVRGEVHDVHRDLLRQPDALVVAST